MAYRCFSGTHALDQCIACCPTHWPASNSDSSRHLVALPISSAAQDGLTVTDGRWLGRPGLHLTIFCPNNACAAAKVVLTVCMAVFSMLHSAGLRLLVPTARNNAARGHASDAQRSTSCSGMQLAAWPAPSKLPPAAAHQLLPATLCRHDGGPSAWSPNGGQPARADWVRPSGQDP